MGHTGPRPPSLPSNEPQTRDRRIQKIVPPSPSLAVWHFASFFVGSEDQPPSPIGSATPPFVQITPQRYASMALVQTFMPLQDDVVRGRETGLRAFARVAPSPTSRAHTALQPWLLTEPLAKTTQYYKRAWTTGTPFSGVPAWGDLSHVPPSRRRHVARPDLALSAMTRILRAPPLVPPPSRVLSLIHCVLDAQVVWSRSTRRRQSCARAGACAGSTASTASAHVTRPDTRPNSSSASSHSVTRTGSGWSSGGSRPAVAQRRPWHPPSRSAAVRRRSNGRWPATILLARATQVAAASSAPRRSCRSSSLRPDRRRALSFRCRAAPLATLAVVAPISSPILGVRSSALQRSTLALVAQHMAALGREPGLTYAGRPHASTSLACCCVCVLQCRGARGAAHPTVHDALSLAGSHQPRRVSGTHAAAALPAVAIRGAASGARRAGRSQPVRWLLTATAARQHAQRDGLPRGHCHLAPFGASKHGLV
jgi:hypothetical protein